MATRRGEDMSRHTELPSAVSVGDWLPPLAGTLAKSSDLSTIKASDKARARKATAEARLTAAPC